MSASDHLHPQQLAMLMPAHQVAKMQYVDAYNQTPESREHMLEHKRERNSWNSMEPHMGKPITVRHGSTAYPSLDPSIPTVYDGHHRLTHALDTDPNREMLVSHEDDQSSGYLWAAQAAEKKR